MTDASCRPHVSRPVDHVVTVVDANWVTPRIRRLVFAGEGLASAFATPEGSHAPYLKLVLGSPEQPIVRTYSVRHLDPARDELQVEFLIHEGDGPGSAFGRAAQPGMQASMRGPWHLGAVRCGRCYLAADHCGVPAMAHLLANLPEATAGLALIEVPDRAEIRHLPAPSGVEVEWLVTPDGAPSALPGRFDGLRPEGLDDALLWVGAEAAIARAVRRIGKAQWRLPPGRCQILNYWRAGRPEGSFSYLA